MMRIFSLLLVQQLLVRCVWFNTVIVEAFSSVHNNNNIINQQQQVQFPTQIEDWDSNHVGSWLRQVGFGRYELNFKEDYDGIGIDGDRLVYLGTPDQLDHIEYQLSLVGVDDGKDQIVLGNAIIELVAAPRIDEDLLDSLARNILNENRDDHDSSNLNGIILPHSFHDEGGDDENIHNNNNHDFQI